MASPLSDSGARSGLTSLTCTAPSVLHCRSISPRRSAHGFGQLPLIYKAFQTSQSPMKSTHNLFAGATRSDTT
eukprot:3340773-Alexandrium_andersonii.AAC.1